MTAAQPKVDLAFLQAKYGGRIENGWVKDATVKGQQAGLYVAGGRVFCGSTVGAYSFQAIGGLVSMELGLPLHVSHERAFSETLSPVPANDNTPTVINPADWANIPVPERSWYIPGLIPSRTVTILSGDGGLGKSLLALQSSTASALCLPTLGMTPKQCRVIYLGAEDEADEFHRRLADIVPALGGTFEQLSETFRLIPLADRDAILAAPNKAGAMQPTALWHQVSQTARDFKPGLIVVDTSADVFGGDEIKRGQVRQFIGLLRGLAIELDCAVLLLSHPSVQGMQSGSGSSGSTAWNNSVRSRLYLTADDAKDGDPDIRILTTKKANYGKAGDAMRLRWREGVFVLDDGKPSPAAGLLNRTYDETFRTLLSAINRTGQRLAPTRGVNYAPAVMAERPDAGGATRKQLEAAMQRLLTTGLVKVVSEGPPSKRRQRLILAAEDFGPEDDAE